MRSNVKRKSRQREEKREKGESGAVQCVEKRCTPQILRQVFDQIHLVFPHIAKLGSYALCGLLASYSTRFVDPGETMSKYSIIIGGANFRCGSSREHAPVALGEAGVAAVVAESYARIFFSNSVAMGEVYRLESEGRVRVVQQRDVVNADLRAQIPPTVSFGVRRENRAGGRWSTGSAWRKGRRRECSEKRKKTEGVGKMIFLPL